MALKTLPGAGLVYPFFPAAQLGMAPALSSTGLIDATGEKIHVVGYVWWSDRGTHDITAVGWLAGAVTSAGGSLIDISLQDVSLIAGPPHRGDGAKDQTVNVALSAVSASAWNENTFGSPRTAVAHNAPLACVWEYDAGGRLGADSLIVSTINAFTTRAGLSSSLVLEAPAGTFNSQTNLPVIVLKTGDAGVVGFLIGAFPVADVTTHAFNTASAADELSNQVKLNVPMTLDGVSLPIVIVNGSANFSVILYEGTTAIETLAVDANTIPGTTGEARWRYFPFTTRRSLTEDTVYRVSVRPDTANNITIYSFVVNTAAYLDLLGGQDYHYWDRVDGGPWGNETLTRMLIMQLHFSQFDDGAGGAGGLLTHPGMAGGCRG
jgi:hypothetical protein